MIAIPYRQRRCISEIRLIDPARELRVLIAFCVFYCAMSFVTGLAARTWPAPVWGATYLTSDAWYLFGYKIGLLLIVPLVALRRAGYTAGDLASGWRATPRSVLTLIALFACGVVINASKLRPIGNAMDAMPVAQAYARVAFGGGVMLLSAGLPEEIVFRWGLQSRLEWRWGRGVAIVIAALAFTAWHLPSRYLLASGAEGSAGDWGAVLRGTGLPVLVVGLIFGLAWDRWRNLPALVMLHWGIDTLPSIASFLRLPP
jgi:membrane protease YdiL (CAAX protease family)